MDNYENNNVTPETVVVSKQEFFKKYAPKSFKTAILITSIIGYVFVAVGLINVLLVSIFAIADTAIQLGLILGVHIAKSKGCAIALLVYGIISMIISTLSMGMLAGWAWVAIPIAYLVVFSKAEKEYKAVYGV